MVRVMKQISRLLLTLSLGGVPAGRAQDAATEERLNKLSGQIEDLIAGQKALQREIADFNKELESVREQANKPNGSYASQEALNRLADSLKEIDRKRLDDYDQIRTDILN